MAKAFLALTIEEQTQFFVELTEQFRLVSPESQETHLASLARQIYYRDQDDDSYLNGLVVALFDQHDEEEREMTQRAKAGGLN